MLPIARNIIHMLMQKDLLTQAEVVDGSSIFAIARQRNRFCYYKRLTGPSYFIKTGHEAEPGARQAMALEAAFYRHFQCDEAFADLRPYLTHLFDFDPETGTLISELVDGAEDLTVIAARAPDEVRGHMPELARCLAVLHTARADGIDAEKMGFDARPHWIFRLSEDPGPLPQLRARSAAGAATIDRILAQDDWRALLDALAQDWRPICLIHGDVKPQNFLAHRSPEQGMQHKIIDWERANIGDPAWDVACGAVTPLMLRLFDADRHGGALGIDDTLTAAVRADMCAFLSAYRASAGADALDAVTPERCAQMVIARILAAAYELNFATDRHNPVADALLALAGHLSSTDAAERLFSLAIDTSEAA